MTQSTFCPDSDTLTSLLSGQLGDSDVERLSRHLEECPHCARLAERLSVEDPLVGLLRSPSTAELNPDDTRINHLIEGLCRLQPRADSHALGNSTFKTHWDIGSVLNPANRAGFQGAIGPYWVRSRIGSGGMAEVYLARQENPNRDVALKLVHARLEGDRELFTRLRSEADAAARLRHPNIVRIYEAGEIGATAYISMELIEGESLAARLARAVLSPGEAATLVGKLAGAVHFAHRNGVVHRDLKPSNVLIDWDGTPKLSDFGLAKILGEARIDHTKTGMIVGTPGYMAPEQAVDGKTVTPAADVYGLGAILYECLTGRPPFKGSTALQTLEQVRRSEPIPPRRLQQGIPRDLETICLKCLEKDPSGRYSSAEALAEDLDRFHRGESITARPSGIPRRLYKWARRRPTVATLLLTSCFLVIVLMAISASYTVRLRTEVDRANTNAIEAHRQEARAGANYRSARAALTQMLRRLDDPRSDKLPRQSRLRQLQLEDALAFYERVLNEFDDPNPEVQLDTALAASEAGEIQFWLARYEPAKETFRKAVELFDQLPGEFRTRPECRTGLIDCLNYLAFMPGELPDRSESYLLRARTEAEELIQADPQDANKQNALAKVEHNLAQQLQERGSFGPAIEHYSRAIEIRARLIAADPKSEIFLGEDLLNLGLAYLSTNQLGLASDAFFRSESLLRPLVEAHPDNNLYKLSLAALSINWGNLLTKSDLPAALVKYDRAVEMADFVAASEPGYLMARSRALQAHGARALARHRARQIAGALSDWDRVVALADEASQPSHRGNRAIVMLEAGMYDRATAEAYALKSDPRISDYNRYNLACILSLASQTMRSTPCLGALAGLNAEEVHKTGAMNLLRQLHTTGYFRKPGFEQLLSDDPDFASLRSRKDFQSLIDPAAKQ